MTPLKNIPFKKSLRTTLILLHLIAIVIGSLPRPITPYPKLNRVFFWTESKLKPIVWNYLYGLGIGQNWEMFTTVDHYDDTWFDANLTDVSGRVRTVVLFNGEQLSPLEKLIRMRELFFFETITGTSNKDVLKSVAKYLAREEDRKGNWTTQGVEIRNLWRPVYSYATSDGVPYQALTSYKTNVSQIP